MPITSYEPQPSGVQVPPQAAAPDAGAPAEAAGGPRPEGALPTSPDDGLERVGIVFVHGIGTQTAGETFLDWSRPIVGLLGEWQHSRTGQTYDPVVRSHFSFHPAEPPILELRIPETGDRAESRWLITEAWWAADLRAPSFTQAREFLSRRLPQILGGLADGYLALERRLADRRRDAHAAADGPGAADPAIGSSGAAGAGVPPGEVAGARSVASPTATGTAPRRWAWVDRLDRLQAKTFGLVILTVPLATLGLVGLVGYSLLRKIPFGPLRAFVELRILDSFLIEWFGDLSILLGDATQAANIRGRVADAIARVQAEGAQDVVLVAHSGGAIVAFETLSDPVFDTQRVTKLVTLGEGLKLAWSLARELPHEQLTASSRVRGDLASHPKLHWVDVWASYDPAPAGPFPSEGRLLVVPPEQVEATRTAHPDRTVVEDRPVTNRMNVLRDHGAYWDNPEGFLIPLVRHLDDPQGSGARSRFYPVPGDRWARIERRRQRVGVLAGWDWLVSLATIVIGALFVLADVLATVTGAAPPFAGRLGATGDAVADVAGRIPGSTVVTGPVDAIARVLGFAASEVDAGSGRAVAGPATAALGVVASWGPGLLGLALLVIVAVAIASFGNARWVTWDRDEGRSQLRVAAPLPDRREPAATAALLLGVLAAFIVGTLGWSLLLGLGVLMVGAAIGLAMRIAASRPRSSSR